MSTPGLFGALSSETGELEFAYVEPNDLDVLEAVAYIEDWARSEVVTMALAEKAKAWAADPELWKVIGPIVAIRRKRREPPP